MEIRAEAALDAEAVHAVHLAAFETPAEARLVDRLRSSELELHSLVAEVRGEVVGHVLFSPVELEGHGGLRVFGLGPMAVRPERQGSGVGTSLAREGLRRLEGLDVQAVVVLGHPGFYPRFGFRPAREYGIAWEHGHDGAFFALELHVDALAGRGGTVRYSAAFDGV